MKKQAKKDISATAPYAGKHAFELPDGHYCFEGNGFEKRGDRVYPSSGRLDWIYRLHDQARGIQVLLDAVNAFAAKQLAQVEADRRRWWEAVAGDLRLLDRPEFERLAQCSDYVQLKPPHTQGQEDSVRPADKETK